MGSYFSRYGWRVITDDIWYYYVVIVDSGTRDTHSLYRTIYIGGKEHTYKNI